MINAINRSQIRLELFSSFGVSDLLSKLLEVV